MPFSLRSPLDLFTAMVLGGLLVLATPGCSEPASSSANADDRSPARQTAFRVRADIGAPLNADEGWAAGPQQSATVPVEQPFRLRFEVEVPPDTSFVERFRLQYRRNGQTWRPVLAADFPYPSGATPRVSVVSTPAYADRDETTDLLDASTASYVGGAGVSLASMAPALTGRGGQSEWEWPVVIRRYADGAVTNEDGDRFEFRMLDAQDRPLSADTTLEVTATVPPRLLAGTFPETPGRIGPWQARDGSLYFLMEPAETYNVLMTVKSEDGGQSWREVDGANRPVTGDLEGFASTMHDGTIHVLHQIDEGVLHHAFRTSDHPQSPDTWAVRDDTLATPGEPPVQVATISARSDGSLVAVYGGPDAVQYSIRTPDGTWGDAEALSDASPHPTSGPQSVAGADDTVHVAYTRRDGTAWFVRIAPDGRRSTPQQISDRLGTSETDIGSVLPLVHLPESNTTVVLYRRASGTLWARRVDEEGALSEPVQVTDRAVAQNPVDSDQTGADAVRIGGSVHVLFVEAASGTLFHTHTTGSRTWATPTPVGDRISAQWVRGNALVRDTSEAPVYGFVYDAGSNGGSGRNWYAEVAGGD